MKMRTNFHKFSVNSRTIDIKFGGIGAIFMGLQPIHQFLNRLLRLLEMTIDATTFHLYRLTVFTITGITINLSR